MRIEYSKALQILAFPYTCVHVDVVTIESTPFSSAWTMMDSMEESVHGSGQDIEMQGKNKIYLMIFL